MHRRPVFSSRLRIHAAALSLSLLAACGGGGGSDDAAPASGGAAPAPGGGASTGADVTCGLANFDADALRLINQHRAAGASCGSRGSFAPTTALAAQAQLTSAAYGHSRDMADNNYFSHNSLDGRTPGTRVTASGYSWSSVGENIAAGYGSVQAVVDGWMASDGHCANLMNPGFTQYGLACARNDASTYRLYWTLNLARP
jgi:uncharacterized protein YkwD